MYGWLKRSSQLLDGHLNVIHRIIGRAVWKICDVKRYDGVVLRIQSMYVLEIRICLSWCAHRSKQINKFHIQLSLSTGFKANKKAKFGLLLILHVCMWRECVVQTKDCEVPQGATAWSKRPSANRFLSLLQARRMFVKCVIALQLFTPFNEVLQRSAINFKSAGQEYTVTIVWFETRDYTTIFKIL